MGSTTRQLDIHKVGKDTDGFYKELSEKIIGQPDAVEAVRFVYNQHLAGLTEPGKPIGSFLFLGPTGSGKTYIVESCSNILLKNPKSVIKVDCAEFQHSHEIAKLIGSPPGYLGHRETHPMLSQEVLNQYHTEKCKIAFVLFDEIEKASDALWNLLLGILDKATLTLGDNRKVDFGRTMIFMTSNLGVREAQNVLSRQFGYHTNIVDAAKDKIKTDAAILRAMKKKFTPEFLNRIDKTVIFKPLDESDIAKVLETELEKIQHETILNAGPDRYFYFVISDAAKKFLIARGVSVEYGARFLKKTLRTYLVEPFSNLLNSEQIHGKDTVLVDYESGEELDFKLEID